MNVPKTVLITGSNAGFGRLTAEVLAQKGHTVFASMRDVDGKNSGAASDMRLQAERENWALHVLELDVTNDESVESAVKRTVDAAGSIDILINNAGVGTFGMTEAFSLDTAERVFDVNVMGVLRVNRAVLPHMRRQGSGLVVYVSSGLGRILFPFLGIYASSKWALEALAETTSYELKPLGIDTAIVEPGAYGTAFGANMIPADDHERFASYGPVTKMAQDMMNGFQEGEFGDPVEVVDAIVNIVEMPSGQRPLRIPVGADLKQGVSAINEVAAGVQSQVMQMLGAN